MTVQTHKHSLVALCFSWTKARKDKIPQRLPQRWNTRWNGNRAAEPVSILKAQHNNLPPYFSCFSLPSPPSPHVRQHKDSSKVSPIKSTCSSADKTANDKVVKKYAFLIGPLIFYLGKQTVDAVLTGPLYHGSWSESLSSNLSPLEQKESLYWDWEFSHSRHTNTCTLLILK